MLCFPQILLSTYIPLSLGSPAARSTLIQLGYYLLSFLLMKKLSANVLAVDTKLLLKRSLSAGGPAGVIACPVNGQLGHGDSVFPRRA